MSQDNLVGLACSVCKRVNYFTKRNKKKIKTKLSMQKFCKWDRKVTLHTEAKLKS